MLENLQMLTKALNTFRFSILTLLNTSGQLTFKNQVKAAHFYKLSYLSNGPSARAVDR